MNILSTVAVFLIAAGAAAQSAKPASSAPPLACNRAAISAAERPRYQHLLSRLKAAVRDVKEQNDGFRLRLDESHISLAEAAEWMTFERKCCPFLAIRLETSGTQPGSSQLILTGPEGAKKVLAAALGVR
jgi:hypothetical protein